MKKDRLIGISIIALVLISMAASFVLADDYDTEIASILDQVESITIATDSSPASGAGSAADLEDTPANEGLQVEELKVVPEKTIFGVSVKKVAAGGSIMSIVLVFVLIKLMGNKSKQQKQLSKVEKDVKKEIKIVDKLKHYQKEKERLIRANIRELEILKSEGNSEILKYAQKYLGEIDSELSHAGCATLSNLMKYPTEQDLKSYLDKSPQIPKKSVQKEIEGEMHEAHKKMHKDHEDFKDLAHGMIHHHLANEEDILKIWSRHNNEERKDNETVQSVADFLKHEGHNKERIKRIITALNELDYEIEESIYKIIDYKKEEQKVIKEIDKDMLIKDFKYHTRFKEEKLEPTLFMGDKARSKLNEIMGSEKEVHKKFVEVAKRNVEIFQVWTDFNENILTKERKVLSEEKDEIGNERIQSSVLDDIIKEKRILWIYDGNEAGDEEVIGKINKTIRGNFFALIKRTDILEKQEEYILEKIEEEMKEVHEEDNSALAKALKKGKINLEAGTTNYDEAGQEYELSRKLEVNIPKDKSSKPIVKIIEGLVCIQIKIGKKINYVPLDEIRKQIK